MKPKALAKRILATRKQKSVRADDTMNLKEWIDKHKKEKANISGSSLSTENAFTMDGKIQPMFDGFVVKGGPWTTMTTYYKSIAKVKSLSDTTAIFRTKDNFEINVVL